LLCHRSILATRTPIASFRQAASVHWVDRRQGRRLAAHKSGGKERGAESGVHHFAFRKYSSTLGRRMSPDPAGIFIADVTNPRVAQT